MAKRKKLFGMNRYQKKSHRRREDRLRGDEVEHYLALAYSENPDERVIAMDNLCPCHVRKRIDKVWVALFRASLTQTCASDAPHGIHLKMAEIPMTRG